MYPTIPTAGFSVHGGRVRRPVPGMPHRVAHVVRHGCGYCRRENRFARNRNPALQCVIV